MIRFLILLVAMFVFENAFAFVAYDMDLKIARCAVEGEDGQTYINIGTYNKSGEFIYWFGGSDFGSFKSVAEAKSALGKLIEKGVCPKE